MIAEFMGAERYQLVPDMVPVFYHYHWKMPEYAIQEPPLLQSSVEEIQNRFDYWTMTDKVNDQNGQPHYRIFGCVLVWAYCAGCKTFFFYQFDPKDKTK